MSKFIPSPLSTGSRYFSVSKRVLAALVAVTLACSCSKPPEATPTPEPEATPEATPPPKPKATATPAATPSPTATPPPKRYAPEGVYYVTEDISVKTATSIFGVSAGTQVKMLKDNGDKMQVTDGKAQFDVKKSQVTNDLDDAAAVIKRTRAVEAASDAARAEADAANAKQAKDQLEYLKSHPLSQPTATPTPGR